MSNRDTEAALRYHEETKHSPYSVRNDQHYMDWSIQPRPFKLYEGLDPIQLPRDIVESDSSLLSLLPRMKPEQPHSRPSLKDVVQLLFFSAGITRKKSYPGGEILFRAASCTGALYEIDLYLVCADLDGLSAGVYHFNPRDFCLYCLRPGDHRQIVASRMCRGRKRCRSAAYSDLDGNLLAQCVEVPRAYLSPLWLGQRNSPSESPHHVHGSPTPGKADPRIP